MSEERYEVRFKMASGGTLRAVFESHDVALAKVKSMEGQEHPWIRFKPDADGVEVHVPRQFLMGVEIERETRRQVAPLRKGNGTAATVAEPAAAADESPAPSDDQASKGEEA